MDLIGNFIVIITLLVYVMGKIEASKNSKCSNELLADTNMIPDSAFTASSYFKSTDTKYDFSPKTARISFKPENDADAWCPSPLIGTESKEYMEIDLGRLVALSIIMTKGRFDKGAGKEFTPFFILKYRRVLTENWRTYENLDKKEGRSKLIKGPPDASWVSFKYFTFLFVTRYIRIYPYSNTAKRICMRTQIFGCNFTNHLLEYRIPQGTIMRNNAIMLPDSFSKYVKLYEDNGYDGRVDKGLLTGGIGTLCDSLVGANIAQEPELAIRYVGWSRSQLASSVKKGITLWFRFENLRNFTSLTINGMNNQLAQLPRQIEVKFSVNGALYSESDVVIRHEPTSQNLVLSNLSDPSVTFSLAQSKSRLFSIGLTLQLTLYFKTDWMILSELTFQSTESKMIIPSKVNKATSPPKIPKDHTSKINENKSKPRVNKNDSIFPKIFWIIIMICILSLLLIFIICGTIICFMRRRKRNKKLLQLYSGTFKHDINNNSSNPNNEIYYDGGDGSICDFCFDSNLFSCVKKHDSHTRSKYHNNNIIIPPPIIGMTPTTNNALCLPTGAFKTQGLENSTNHHMYTPQMMHVNNSNLYLPHTPSLSGNYHANNISQQQQQQLYSDINVSGGGGQYDSIQSNTTHSDNGSIDNMSSHLYNSTLPDYNPSSRMMGGVGNMNGGHIISNPIHSTDTLQMPLTNPPPSQPVPMTLHRNPQNISTEPDIVAMLPTPIHQHQNTQLYHPLQYPSQNYNTNNKLFNNLTPQQPQNQYNNHQSPVHLSLLNNQY